ncbi:MAG: hypothetical protein BWY76_01311 [bacterium ADurb.Bin429]|nr:MAG: hypothetical protein BWY76_01311 [bacterium ADurb.Bin429]
MLQRMSHHNARRDYGLIVILFALALTLCSSAFAQDGQDAELKTVVAQGVGAGPDKAKARDEAIQDAQRKAVEQGLGLFIKSETLVQNLQLVSDTIYKESSGFVHTYTVDSENYNAEKDLYWVKITAKVSLQRLETRLDNLYEKLKIAGNPRIIIALNGTASLRDPEGIANALTAELVEKGFKVIDDEQLIAVRQKDALRLIRNGDIDAKTVMLLQDKADIIIVGKVSADAAERILDDPVTISQKVTLDARIVRVDTARILGAKRGLGVGAGFSAKAALEAAEEKAGTDYLAKNLRTLLQAVLDPCKEYTVKVTPCTFGQLTAVENKLVESRFVRQVDARFEEGYGTLSVFFSGSAKLLAMHLESQGENGIRLKVVSVTGVSVMVKPAHD